jgi:serine protease Do
VKSGTAFFVSTNGRLLTSAHLLTGCHHVTIWPPGQPSLPATILSIDRDLDVALVEVRISASPPVIPNGLRAPRSNEEVSMIAYGVHPDAPRDARLAIGTVVGGRPTPNGRLVTVIRARLQPGTSGAPVVDANGTLLGVVMGRYASAPELAVAVSKDDLFEFLARNGIVIPLGPPHRGPSSAELLSRMSALIQCEPISPK